MNAVRQTITVGEMVRRGWRPAVVRSGWRTASTGPSRASTRRSTRSSAADQGGQRPERRCVRRGCRLGDELRGRHGVPDRSSYRPGDRRRSRRLSVLRASPSGSAASGSCRRLRRAQSLWTRARVASCRRIGVGGRAQLRWRPEPSAVWVANRADGTVSKIDPEGPGGQGSDRGRPRSGRYRGVARGRLGGQRGRRNPCPDQSGERGDITKRVRLGNPPQGRSALVSRGSTPRFDRPESSTVAGRCGSCSESRLDSLDPAVAGFASCIASPDDERRPRRLSEGGRRRGHAARARSRGRNSRRQRTAGRSIPSRCDRVSGTRTASSCSRATSSERWSAFSRSDRQEHQSYDGIVGADRCTTAEGRVISPRASSSTARREPSPSS